MGLFQEEKKNHKLVYSGNTHMKNQVHNQVFAAETDEGNLGNLEKMKKEDDMGELLVGHLGR